MRPAVFVGYEAVWDIYPRMSHTWQVNLISKNNSLSSVDV